MTPLSSTVLASLLSLSTQAAEPEARLPAKSSAFLRKYCLDCHDASSRKGKVNLEDLPLHITTIEQAEQWQKVLNALNAGEMPPEKKPQPGNEEKSDFLDALAKTMVVARKVLSDSGGKITMRRLNRREYRNTIEHLTGVTVDVAPLPQDGGGGAFDTAGASQFISSDQFEQYLKLGRRAIDEAFERRKGHPTRVFRVEPEKTINVEREKTIRDLEKTYDKFLQWKAGVDRAAATPENREVMAGLRKKYPTIDRDLFRLYRNANLLKGAPNPKEFGFRDHNAAAQFFQGNYNRHLPHLKNGVALPQNDRGAYLKIGWGINRFDVSPKPNHVPPGRYILRIRAGVVEGAPSFRHFIEIGHPQRQNRVPRGFAGFPISSHHVTGTLENPSTIEIPVEVGASTQREFAIQERQPFNRNAYLDWHNRYKRENGYGIPPAIWIDWMELEGPLPPSGLPPVLTRVFKRHAGAASDSERARAILTEFALAAFRQGTPDPRFIDQLLDIHERRRKSGEPFDVAIRTPLSVTLASPGFLYLHEPGDESKPRELTDRELAVRLAYFLWSGPPDATLLDLAQKNGLRKPQVLRAQVDRMIADPRADRFVSGFVHQWLDMERLDFFQFDGALHREFDENTRAAAREEVYKSFAHLLRDPDSGRLGKLLKSDTVIINGLLAVYYGIDGVSGDQFREVVLPAGSPRGGLLGMAAIHAMGSDGIVSSPVERGAWILRHLLHDPPPPAPPNVPQISRLEDQVLTTRERLQAHQEEPQCASCHRKIDPIGFALENFTAAGKWRTQDFHLAKDRKGRRTKKTKSWDIDASGAFHNGPPFKNYPEFRDLVSKREADFARGFTEHLIAYGLGRPFGFTDEDLANTIVAAAGKKNYIVIEFIHALVQSEAFGEK